MHSNSSRAGLVRCSPDTSGTFPIPLNHSYPSHPYQTCRHLQSASTSPSIWKALLQNHLDRSPYVQRLERPISLYTSTELEYSLLRRIATQGAWSAPGFSPFQRLISPENGDVHSAHLVPGGRWLLVFSQTHEVHYYDLDNPSAPARLLMAFDFEECENKILVMDLDREIDPNAPFLSFNVAFSIQLLEGSRSHSVVTNPLTPLTLGRTTITTSVIQIYNIELDESSPTLHATFLSSFPILYTSIVVLELTISGPKVAYGSSSYPRHIVVVDWAVAGAAVGPNILLDDPEMSTYPKHIIFPESFPVCLPLANAIIANTTSREISGSCLHLCSSSSQTLSCSYTTSPPSLPRQEEPSKQVSFAPTLPGPIGSPSRHSQASPEHTSVQNPTKCGWLYSRDLQCTGSSFPWQMKQVW